MPEDGVELKPREEILTFEEIERLAGLFVREGVDKIRLTGGEPLLRRGFVDLAGRLGALPGLKTLAITTNGLLLSKMLPGLKAGGVTHLNISLDTLRSDRFKDISRHDGFTVVRGAIHDAMAHGYTPLKVNCVVMRGFNEDELVDFVALTEAHPIDVRFIEYMPFGGNGWTDGRFLPYREMIRLIEARFPALERRQDAPNDTAKNYRVPGFRGSVGFISSMSDDFCGTCNRLRITADGNLKVCLFGRAEVSLRDAIRDGATDGALRELITTAVTHKKAAHAGMHELASAENRPMILIGG